MLDVAEFYVEGNSESELGQVIKELSLRRTDLVITTRLFWGTRKGPNDAGLSRKHIFEGTKDCLNCLEMDQVDVIFAHRADHNVNQGWVLYRSTSEWSTREIEAHHTAHHLGLIAPIAEQCQHHMFSREHPESEYARWVGRRLHGMGFPLCRAPQPAAQPHCSMDDAGLATYESSSPSDDDDNEAESFCRTPLRAAACDEWPQ
ncbi:hypothetical protein HWV62_22014 [Athelia sp. TMB]|nr:hypothetical protein HWV62_26172 [Athelia sp. TMB]KAF7971133.1 hypothetical protein HWV62_22014 [Athelia sp. TMB]